MPVPLQLHTCLKHAILYHFDVFMKNIGPKCPCLQPLHHRSSNLFRRPPADRGSISTGRLGGGDGEGTKEHDGDEGYLGVASVGATVDGGGLTTGAGARQRGRWRAVEV